MAIEEILHRVQDMVTVERVYGEPQERDGVTVLPAAMIVGGGGGGGGHGPQGEEGSGGGFTVFSRPVGAYVIKSGEATWRPAVDVNLMALFLLFALRAMMKARRKRKK